jgi:hypothetical protein
LLASVSLALAHPISGTPLHIEASPSADFQSLLSQLGWPAYHEAAHRG